MSLPRYPEYKDSGVRWLGKVPQHWDTCALNYRYEVALGKMLDSKQISGESLAAYLRNVDVQWGKINAEDLPQMDFTGEDLTRFRLQEGDLLVCEGGEVGRAAIWEAPLSECYYQKALHRLRPRQGRDTTRFMYFALAGAVGLGIFSGEGGKATIAHLPAESFRRYRFAFPPVDEQHAIATFLDRETAKIDALIAEQEKLLALLAEKRQATISHAVTRGLNPSATMKDSGIPWLGEVPAHWVTPPLRLRYACELGKMLDSAKISGEHLVPYLRNTDVQWDRINVTDLPEMDISEDEYPRYTVRPGDLLVCEGGEVGRAGVVRDVSSVLGFQKALHRLRPCADDENARFMYYTFCWAAERGVFDGAGQATIAHLTGEQLRAYRFPKPPVFEQHEIVSFLDAEIGELDGLRTEAERGIALLTERRSALISAAVTGKIDIRETA